MADKDDEIVREAHERFKLCMDFEGDFRKLFVDDLKFCEADADNGYQWPNDLRKNREIDARPCLTVNKVQQNVKLITNDAKQNKPAIEVEATGGDASYESAQIFEGVVRHIEYISNAEGAYDTAIDNQVKGGIGYWRVVTEYANDNSFDQDIFIRRVKNPMNVLIDPDCNEEDRSDARYGFVFDDMPKDEFERKYPEHKDLTGSSPLGSGVDWCRKDSIRVAEYYRCEYKKDQLIALPMPNPVNPAGEPIMQMVKASELPPEILKQIKADKTIRRRDIQKKQWKWYLIAADQIIDSKDWPGEYLPLVAVVGEECMIEGKLERKGHVRAQKDPQRMYNYWTSSAVEQVALQGKQPYIAAAEAIEGFENYYENANVQNYAYLPYNGVDEQGQTVPPPAREQPPVMAQAYLSGMQIAAEEIKMVSGQYDPSQGNNPLDQSGVALRMQQRRGDGATSHFSDNLAKAIRYTGKILIDLVPKIYDTPRIIRILGEDGTDETVQIDPNLQRSMQEIQTREGEVQRIFNPMVGEYDVVADAGPSYATRRDEAFDAMSVMLQQQPQFMGVFGDLYFRAANFPMAEELAERVKRTIPPDVLGEGPSQDLQAAQAQIQQLQSQLASAMSALADADKDKKDRGDIHAIDSYKAVTDRLDKLLKAISDNPGAGMLLHGLTSQTVHQAASDPDPQADNIQAQLQAVPQPPQEQQQPMPQGIPPMMQ